jgi:hypothetical protein
MCLRHREDPAYPKYPRLPVLRCAGHEPRAREAASRSAPGDAEDQVRGHGRVDGPHGDAGLAAGPLVDPDQ